MDSFLFIKWKKNYSILYNIKCVYENNSTILQKPDDTEGMAKWHQHILFSCIRAMLRSFGVIFH